MREAVSLEVIGSTFEAGGFERFLKKHDPCFGQHYTKNSSVCKACRAPVVIDGKLALLKDVCAARCRGADSPEHLKRITSQELLDRLSSGKSIEDVFREVVSISGQSQEVIRAARQLLYNRLYYLENEKGVPVPDLPSTQELAESLR